MGEHVVSADHEAQVYIWISVGNHVHSLNSLVTYRHRSQPQPMMLLQSNQSSGTSCDESTACMSQLAPAVCLLTSCCGRPSCGLGACR